MTTQNAVMTAKTVSKKVQAQVLDALESLKDIPVDRVPFHTLKPTELNVRKRAPDAIKLVELAQSIKSVGILQNLVVFDMPDGKFGVAAGSRRHAALKMLIQDGTFTPDYLVPVKRIAQEMAVVISLTENGLREDMHPADQLAAFSQLSAAGRSARDISGLMGFNTKHVQKCLQLVDMPSQLLDALAADEIDLEQLQALSASSDQERQLNVWNNATDNYRRRPEYLRQEVLRGEISACKNTKLDFVTREVYEQAGGTFRMDLFTDEGFISDPVLLDRLTLEKLGSIAGDVARDEGWNWSEGRENRLCAYGDDAEKYTLLSQPDSAFTEEEAQKRAMYALKLARLKFFTDKQISDRKAHERDIAEIILAIENIDRQADIRAWADEGKAETGVIACLHNGTIALRRGVKLRVMKQEASNEEGEAQLLEKNASPACANDPIFSTKPMSAALVKSLPSERTLAVQATLAQQPHIALVIFVHDCLKSMFAHNSRACSTMKFTLNRNAHTLVDNARTAVDSIALQTINIMHDTWKEKLPEGWHLDWAWLLTWSNKELIAVMGYCLAGTLDGVTEKLDRESKARGVLEPVERQLGFKLHDWWQPDVANFFGRISKDSISDVLTAQGNSVLAREVMKMKKADAASVAAKEAAKAKWLPECMSWQVLKEAYPAEL